MGKPLPDANSGFRKGTLIPYPTAIFAPNRSSSSAQITIGPWSSYETQPHPKSIRSIRSSASGMVIPFLILTYGISTVRQWT